MFHNFKYFDRGGPTEGARAAACAAQTEETGSVEPIQQCAHLQRSTPHQRELRASSRHSTRVKRIRPRWEDLGRWRWMRRWVTPPPRGWGAGGRMICTPQEKSVFAPPSWRCSDLSAHSSLASGPLHHIHGGPAPGTPLYEEEDDDGSWSRENTGVSSGDSSGLLPWHHQQLYRLYGKSAADEFLYPKFEDKKRTVAPKAINPKLRRQGGTYRLSKGLFTL